VEKVARNVTRDARNGDALATLGWRVEVVWECDLRDAEGMESRLAHILTSPVA
jgi:DNA mismatch endonuclease (patch repair protein)